MFFYCNDSCGDIARTTTPNSSYYSILVFSRYSNYHLSTARKSLHARLKVPSPVGSGSGYPNKAAHSQRTGRFPDPQVYKMSQRLRVAVWQSTKLEVRARQAIRW